MVGDSGQIRIRRKDRVENGKRGGKVSRQRKREKREKRERRGERKTQWPIILTLYIHFKHSGSGAIDIVSPRALMSTRDQTMRYERYTLTTQASRAQEA